MLGDVCEIEVPTRLIEMFRDPIIDFVFPFINYEVRSDVIKYLYDREDTAYGVSIGIMKPLPSVAKALKELEKFGYVIREEKKSPRREGKASVYRLSKIGKLAAFVLLSPNADLPPIDVSKLDTILNNIGYPEYKDIIMKWLNNSTLRKILTVFAPLYLPKSIVESEVTDEEVADIVLIKAIVDAINVFSSLTIYVLIREMKELGVEGKISEVLNLVEESFISSETLLPRFVKYSKEFKKEFNTYAQVIEKLLKCTETRKVLIESVKELLDSVEHVSLNTLLIAQAISYYLELGDLGKVEEKIKTFYTKVIDYKRL